MVHKKAWNTRTASNNTPQNNNDNVNSLLKDYQDAAIIANRKYELRNHQKVPKLKEMVLELVKFGIMNCKCIIEKDMIREEDIIIYKIIV